MQQQKITLNRANKPKSLTSSY